MRLCIVCKREIEADRFLPAAVGNFAIRSPNMAAVIEPIPKGIGEPLGAKDSVYSSKEIPAGIGIMGERGFFSWAIVLVGLLLLGSTI